MELLIFHDLCLGDSRPSLTAFGVDMYTRHKQVPIIASFFGLVLSFNSNA